MAGEPSPAQTGKGTWSERLAATLTAQRPRGIWGNPGYQGARPTVADEQSCAALTSKKLPIEANAALPRASSRHHFPALLAAMLRIGGGWKYELEPRATSTGRFRLDREGAALHSRWGKGGVSCSVTAPSCESPVGRRDDDQRSEDRRARRSEAEAASVNTRTCEFPRVLIVWGEKLLDGGRVGSRRLESSCQPSSRVCNPPSVDCALQSTKPVRVTRSRSGEAPISPTSLSNEPVRAGAASGEITPPWRPRPGPG